LRFWIAINIGYAQLQMKQTLTFSDATYGFGAGIFFVGYFLFEVPSNLLLERIGVRRPCYASCSRGVLSHAHGVRADALQFYVADSCLARSKRAFSLASFSI